MPIVTSLLERYDIAILDWLVADFAGMFPATPAQVLFATPDRQYAEYTTLRTVDQEMLRLPRIYLYRGDEVPDPLRYNSNSIRKLFEVQGQYRSGGFPAPINLPYQIGFWTDKGWQMNRWIQKFLWIFRSRRRYFTTPVADPGQTPPVWGDKLWPLFLESLVNNSDLEPDEGPRLIRREASLLAATWIFDPDVYGDEAKDTDLKPILSGEISYSEQVDPAILDNPSDPGFLEIQIEPREPPP